MQCFTCLYVPPVNSIVNIPLRILYWFVVNALCTLLNVCVFNGMNALPPIESYFFVERGRLLPDCLSVLDEYDAYTTGPV